jgi:hypothetical protein
VEQPRGGALVAREEAVMWPDSATRVKVGIFLNDGLCTTEILVLSIVEMLWYHYQFPM